MPVMIAFGVLFALSLGTIWGGLVRPFTEDTSRAVNVSKIFVDSDRPAFYTL